MALAQILAGPDPQANLGVVVQVATEAEMGGAQLVVFPEATVRCLGFPRYRRTRGASPVTADFAEIAERHALVIIAGMFCPSADGRVHGTPARRRSGSRCLLRKIHLFPDAFGFVESQTVAPGSEPVIISIGGVQVGLTTCYDVRFPGLYTRLADLGPQGILSRGILGCRARQESDEWKLLSRARALDSTTYLVAAGTG